MAKPIKVISEIDVQQVIPNFSVSWLEDNKSDAKILLWNLGINTDYNIEVQLGLSHRTQMCGIQECPRIVGIERTDRPYLLSGHASLEAKEYTVDLSLRKELKDMKNGGAV